VTPAATALTNCEEETQMNWGVTLGATHGIFGFQEDIGYAPDFFGKTPGASNAVLHLMSDLMIPCRLVRSTMRLHRHRRHPSARELRRVELAASANTRRPRRGRRAEPLLHAQRRRAREVRHLRTFKDFTFPGFSSDKARFLARQRG
jgi:hypothetical protein